MLRKVWKSGTSLVISIPKEIIEVLKLRPGDYLNVPDNVLESIPADDVKQKKPLNAETPTQPTAE